MTDTTSGSQDTGHATPVVMEKAGQRFQEQLVQGVRWQKAKREVPFLKWDRGTFETGGSSTRQVTLEFQDPV